MHPGLEYVVTSATARKGNHPVLWLLFGCIGLLYACTGIWDGVTIVVGTRLFETFFGWPSFTRITFASEPVLFAIWAITTILFAFSCLVIGSIALWLRHGPQKPRHPWARFVRR